jgi:hypothetical protein
VRNVTEYIEPWDFTSLNVRKGNRDIAAQWMAEGERPIVLIIGSLVVWFDAITVKLRIAAWSGGHLMPELR